MSSAQRLLDTAGRHRSPATLPEFHAGRAPGNKGQRYAADPPTVDEIIAVMRHARHARYGNRLNGLIVVLWRAGLRINEALSLTETDLDEQRGLVLGLSEDLCRHERKRRSCLLPLEAGPARRAAAACWSRLRGLRLWGGGSRRGWPATIAASGSERRSALGNRGAARPADTPWRQHWSMCPWAARLVAVGFVKLSGCRRIGGSAMR